MLERRIDMINADNPRIRVFTNFVRDLATLSKCTDKGVAAIIINSDATQVYSIGINGGPKGGLDCLCTLGGKYTCVHAEANALAKCTAIDQNKIMICSLSPCVTCASLIVNSGFSAVFYLAKYKDDEGLNILTKTGIRTFCIGESTIRYAKGGIVPLPEVDPSCYPPNAVPLSPSPEYIIPIPLTGDPLAHMPMTICAAVKTFMETGSVTVGIDDPQYQALKAYINNNHIRTRAHVDAMNNQINIRRE